MKPIRLAAVSLVGIALILFVINACQKPVKSTAPLSQTSPDPASTRSWFENTAIPNENAAVASGKKLLVHDAPLIQYPRLAGIGKLIDWDNARMYHAGSAENLVVPFKESLHPFSDRDFEAARAIVFSAGPKGVPQFRIVEVISNKGGHLNPDIRDVAAAVTGKTAQPVSGVDAHVIVYNRYYAREAMYTYSNGSPSPGTMSIANVPHGYRFGDTRTALSTKVALGCSGSGGYTEDDIYFIYYSPATGLDYVYEGPDINFSTSSGYGNPQNGYTLPPPGPIPYNPCDLATSLEQNTSFNAGLTSLQNELNNGYESAFLINAQGVPQAQINGGPYGQNIAWSTAMFNNTTGFVFNHEYESAGYSSMFNFLDMTNLAMIFTLCTPAGSPNDYIFSVTTPAGSYLLVITDKAAWVNFAWAFMGNSSTVNGDLFTVYNYYINIYNSDATNEVNFCAFLNQVSGGSGLTLMKLIWGAWQTVWYDDSGNPTYTPC
ncbi:MAG TPA: hypothetical protein VL547_00950 [Dinghuibacter sp.]|uniref:hypothetical protein n=1 Tax=Dinghuibacter sp. TaxID=2024697 RepID=UPI002C01E143|nr:hypothetical protein [Dinghuibacter sp.]HTJ10555.1 hypothetical protein [Dinghuibacter sp.]